LISVFINLDHRPFDNFSWLLCGRFLNPTTSDIMFFFFKDTAVCVCVLQYMHWRKKNQKFIIPVVTFTFRPVYSVNKCDIKQNKIMQRNCYGRYMDIRINRSCVTNGWFDRLARFDFHLISALYDARLNDFVAVVNPATMPDAGTHKRCFKFFVRRGMKMSNAAMLPLTHMGNRSCKESRDGKFDL